MLFVFAFSITPQKSIHDIVAHHVDPTTCDVHQDFPMTQVEKSSIHCSYDNLVATTPFVQYNFEIIIAAPITAKVTNTYFTVNYFSASKFTFESRGPPAV
jgi:hypothetical protein